MDLEYWETFYKKGRLVTTPSDFARWLVGNHIFEKDSVLELGCGNGRDAVFFGCYGCSVIGVDQSSAAVRVATKNARLSGLHEAVFRQNDVSELELSFDPNVSVIYARFFLHTITESQQSELLKKSYDALPVGGRFAFEARTTKDPLYGMGSNVGKHTFRTDHNRRFLDTAEVLQEIVKLGFSTRYSQENTGFAKFGEEDPTVLRCVLEK